LLLKKQEHVQPIKSASQVSQYSKIARQKGQVAPKLPLNLGEAKKIYEKQNITT
jgi:hypothetical protein